MSVMNEQYEKLVLEEDDLLTKIRLCEDCQWAILEVLSHHGELGKEIGEEITATVHTIEQDFRTELLHLRLEKGSLAGKISNESSKGERRRDNEG